MKSNSPMMTIVVAVVAGVIGLGVGFFVGKMPQFSGASTQAAAGTGNFGAGTGTRGGATGRGGFRGGAGTTGAGGVFGQITAADAQSITVKMSDGSSKIVLISGSTMYSAMAPAAQTDLKTGANVRVIGTANSDGSVTATAIMLNPNMPKMMTPGASGMDSPMPSSTPSSVPQY